MLYWFNFQRLINQPCAFTGTPPTDQASVRVIYKLIERNSKLQLICDFTPDADHNIKYIVSWYKNKTEIKVFHDISRPEDAAIDDTLIQKAGSQVF